LLAAGVAEDLAELMTTLVAAAQLYGRHHGEIGERIAQDRLLRQRQSERGKWDRGEANWKPHAGELQQQIEAEGYLISPPTIAQEIIARWKLGDIEPPSAEWLAKWIRKKRKCTEPGSIKD
jgi:hypothetical protein